MKTILITGSSGMLGSKLFHIFNEDSNYDAFQLNRTINSNIPSKKQRIIDLSKPFRTDDVGFCPDIVLHAAAITDLSQCELNPTIAHQVNVNASMTLAALVRNSGYIYYISTDSVFDGKKGNYSESDLPNPLNVYARTKYLGETVVAETAANSTIVRTNIYGFHRPLKNSLAEWALAMWQTGKKISGFTDIMFNAVYTGQLAAIIKLMIDRVIQPSIIHVGSGSTISKYQFLDLIRQKLKIDGSLLVPALSDDFPSLPIRPKNTSLSIGLLKEIIEPPTFEEGIDQWLEDFNCPDGN